MSALPLKSASVRLATTPLAVSRPPGMLLDAAAAAEDPAVLESSALHDRHGRYTIIACQPIEVLTLAGGTLRNRAGNTLADDDEGIWRTLGEALGSPNLTGGGDRPPYCPGWIGYAGYELGRHVERLPARAPRDTLLPDLRLAFYDAVLVYDALHPQWTLVELAFDRDVPGAGLAGEKLRSIAAEADAAAPEPPPDAAERADAAELGEVDYQANFTPDEYRRAVAKCVDYVAAGDIFQVNLSQRLTVADAPPPKAIYRALRRRNPAWYAGYLSFESPGGPCAVISSSPELFLQTRDGLVTTRPIKGTRRRTGWPDADAQAAAALWNSPKDNAELAMIIDLLRNDIGRVCRYGTVKVTEPRRLETHPTVFHLVGTVVGQLRHDVGPAELLRATFPGGSITGAPKIRAMEIIDELEPVARGVYTGSIGHVGVDGSCTWNIAIRTVVWDRGRAHVQAGGGIVADSTPDAEYQETLDKARALLEAIAQARVDAR